MDDVYSYGNEVTMGFILLHEWNKINVKIIYNNILVDIFDFVLYVLKSYKA